MQNCVVLIKGEMERMRVLVQRVGEAEVEVQGRLLARIGPGFLLLVSIGANRRKPRNKGKNPCT